MTAVSARRSDIAFFAAPMTFRPPGQALVDCCWARGWLAPPVLLAMVAAGQFHPLSDGWLPVWFALSSAGAVYSNTYDVLLLIAPIVLAAGALKSRRRSAFVIISGAVLLFVVMWCLHTI